MTGSYPDIRRRSWLRLGAIERTGRNIPPLSPAGRCSFSSNEVPGDRGGNNNPEMLGMITVDSEMGSGFMFYVILMYTSCSSFPGTRRSE